MKKKDICIDFDGVLNNYTGWKGEDELFEMKEGCDKFLAKVSKSYNITILTTRNALLVEKWLKKYNLSDFITRVTNKKIPAEIYIDDRAIRFNGSYDEVFTNIESLFPYWKQVV